LRDRRYKLVQYSKDELTIQLSNVTVHDEGIYRCFYYSIPFKSKNKTVEVLAAPSNPVLEVSQGRERTIILSCYTQGCKPQPQVSWLLDNGIELPGDTKHKLEADGKKWSTTSTLTVLAYGPNSSASCIVRHRALGEENLMASFWFGDLSRIAYRSTLVLSPGTTAASERSSSTASTPSYNPQAAQHQHQLSKTSSQMSHLLVKKDLNSESFQKKENHLLLPILVTALIFVMLIIVLLFMRKLKKAHGVWKKENDVSEQTLESYKSKSNEDSPGHETN
ncbi:Cytotoxic and regulatory T-cell molecule, partial [Chaetura pelagica]